MKNVNMKQEKKTETRKDSAKSLEKIIMSSWISPDMVQLPLFNFRANIMFIKSP